MPVPPLAQPVSRRLFVSRTIALVAASAASTLLAACGGGAAPPAAKPPESKPAPAAEPTKPAAPAAQPTAAQAAPAQGKAGGKLVVGAYSYIPEGIPLDDIVKQYMDSHPGVQVEVQLIGVDLTRDAPAFVQRMSAEAQQRRSAYDIIAGPTTWIEPALMARVQAIDPIEPYVPKSLLDDLYPPVRKGATYTDGKLYSMPWWADVVGFIYRKSMLKESVGTDQPPETWDQVLDYSAKIKARLGDKVAAYGADWPRSHRLFLPIMAAMTQNFYTPEGLWNMDDASVPEALELVKKLYPYMPASSAEDLGSSKAFQAGGVAMETYWPTQLLRAIQAKQPEDDMAMTANPKAKTSGTLFWNADIVIPKYSNNKEEAGRFMNEALLSELTVEKSYANWKVLPYKSINERFLPKMPGWAKPLISTLETGSPIPMNPFWLGFEQPIFKEEVEKMILQDQSTKDTQTNIAQRIKQQYKEFQG
ncbi:MAG TPA: extracellular solute-binding protein [Chloroflexota bacterium]|nr:extracellular solute-binding protein [Chloroflexota bacterium]